MGLEVSESVIDDAEAVALESAADPGQQRTGISRAPVPGQYRRRLLEAVPEFAFLAIPEQDLD